MLDVRLVLCYKVRSISILLRNVTKKRNHFKKMYQLTKKKKKFNKRKRRTEKLNHFIILI